MLPLLHGRWRLAALVAVLALGGCLERGTDKQRSPEEVVAELSPERPAEALKQIRDEEPEGLAVRDATIVVRLESEPLHLNPLLAGDAQAVRIALGDIYEGLLTIDRPGQSARPSLAKSYVRSGDGRRWDFFLRSGVRFHDGSLMRAADVVRSFELIGETPGPLLAEFDDLVSVKADGLSSVTLQFQEARYGRAEAIAAVPILSKRAFAGLKGPTLHKAPASRQPVGTGPLRFVSWKDGVIELARFDDYWGPAARAKTIRHRWVAERQQVVAQLRSGGLDAALQLPVQEALDALKDNPDLVAVRQSLPAYTAAVYNTERANLGVDARRALSKTFDRQALVRELLGGYGAVAIGPFVPNSERADYDLEQPHFSLQAGKEELAELWSGVPPLTLLVPSGSRTMERVADIWAADLRGLAKLDVQRLPFAELLKRVRSGDFDVALLSFTTSSDVDLFSLFHSSEIGSGNLSRLRDQGVDSIIEGLRRAISHEERVERSRLLHRQLLYLAPFSFLTTDVRLGLVRRDIAGTGDGVDMWGARSLWRRR